MAAAAVLLLAGLAVLRRPAKPYAVGRSVVEEEQDLGVPSRGGTAGQGPTLERAAAAVQLEALVDADPMLGVCYRGRSLLPGVPAHVCRRLQVRRVLCWGGQAGRRGGAGLGGAGRGS